MLFAQGKETRHDQAIDDVIDAAVTGFRGPGLFGKKD